MMAQGEQVRDWKGRERKDGKKKIVHWQAGLCVFSAVPAGLRIRQLPFEHIRHQSPVEALPLLEWRPSYAAAQLLLRHALQPKAAWRRGRQASRSQGEKTSQSQHESKSGKRRSKTARK